MDKDLELYDLIWQALCQIPNKKLRFDDKVPDTYSLVWLIDERVKELTGQSVMDLRRAKALARN
jgi:hypothetical protein